MISNGFIRLVETHGNAALQVVNAARISFNSSTSSLRPEDTKLIKYLRSHGHTSPFRHTFFTFHIKAPIFVFRQWMKYQVGSTWRTYEIDGVEHPVRCVDHLYDTDKGCSWNEVSGRYSRFAPEFYIPEPRGQAVTNKQGSVPYTGDSAAAIETIQKAHVEAYEAYKRLLELGVAREVARLVLPPTLMSEAYWTVSLQGVLHFLAERTKEDAQMEIRMYAEEVKRVLGGVLEGVLLEGEEVQQ